MVFTYPLGIDRYVGPYISMTLRLSEAIANLALNTYIGFVAFYTIGAWLTFFLRCRVFSGFWDSRYSDTCYTLKYVMQFGLVNAGKQTLHLSDDAYIELYTAFNIFTDVCFATLPIPIIWSLQMSQRTRISLMVVLSLGYL